MAFKRRETVVEATDLNTITAAEASAMALISCSADPFGAGVTFSSGGSKPKETGAFQSRLRSPTACAA